MLSRRPRTKMNQGGSSKLGNDKLDGVNHSALSIQPKAVSWPFASMRQALTWMRRGRATTLGLTFAFAFIVAKMALDVFRLALTLTFAIAFSFVAETFLFGLR